jgi:flavin-dependent dehydrogenase
VVGGSIAGATTALRLARLGHSVRILERARLPRRKACGEGLFAKGVDELEKLGVLPEVLTQSARLESLRMQLDGESVEAALDKALGVRRETLDVLLLDLAASAGVEVYRGVNVLGLIDAADSYAGVRTDHGDFKAQVIVAADGLRSRLRQQCGLDASATRGLRYGVSAHMELPEQPRPRVNISFHDGYEVYVTPAGGPVVNVAVLISRERAGSLAGNLEAGFSQLARSGPGISAGHLLDAPAVAGPFQARSKRAWSHNLVLAGDAAGFYDGISGEGMSLALLSARGCAEAVHAYLNDGNTRHFELYDRALRRRQRNSTLLARLNLALAARPSLGLRALRNLSRRPATFERLLSINQGLGGFDSLRPRDLTALLFGR